MEVKQIKADEVIKELAEGKSVIRFVKYKNGNTCIQDLSDYSIKKIQEILNNNNAKSVYFSIKK